MVSLLKAIRIILYPILAQITSLAMSINMDNRAKNRERVIGKTEYCVDAAIVIKNRRSCLLFNPNILLTEERLDSLLNGIAVGYAFNLAHHRTHELAHVLLAAFDTECSRCFLYDGHYFLRCELFREICT